MERRMKLGADSEELVAGVMRRRGYDIISRNFRLRCGELDIVARRGREVVVVEVRSRRDDLGEAAMSSIREGKRDKIRRTASLFLARRPVDYDEVRFFVAAVNWSGGEPTIDIVEDAF